MNNRKEVRRAEIGFAEALTLLFIGLKLAKVITWPWLLVLSPMWITLTLTIVLVIIAVAISEI